MFLQGAMIADPEDIFYHPSSSQTKQNLYKNVIMYSAVEPETHKANLEKGLKSLTHSIAIGSKTMRSKTMAGKLVTGAYRFLYYKIKPKKAQKQGKYFMNIIDQPILMELFKLEETKIAKAQMKKQLPDIDIDEKIYIPITREDVLTLDNIHDDDIPFMIQNDLDLDFEYNKKSTDQYSHVKVRINSRDDWGAINWKTGERLTNEVPEQPYSPILIFIHGGGFISGSSSAVRPLTHFYTIDSGFHVFSIDYNVGPDVRYPEALSD